MVSAVSVSFSFTHVPHAYPMISSSFPSVATKNISGARSHLYCSVSFDAISSSGYEFDSMSAMTSTSSRHTGRYETKFDGTRENAAAAGVVVVVVVLSSSSSLLLLLLLLLSSVVVVISLCVCVCVCVLYLRNTPFFCSS